MDRKTERADRGDLGCAQWSIKEKHVVQTVALGVGDVRAVGRASAKPPHVDDRGNGAFQDAIEEKLHLLTIGRDRHVMPAGRDRIQGAKGLDRWFLSANDSSSFDPEFGAVDAVPDHG